MLKIEITDPHTLPKQTLIDVATLLMKMGGVELLPNPNMNVRVVQPVAGAPIPLPPAILPALAQAHANHSQNVIPSAPVEEEAPAPMVNPFAGNSFDPNTIKTPSGEISAPIPPPYKAPAPKSNVETDCNGLPWDARIHSRTKSKTVDGAWKLQRGIDMKTVGDVTKELESVMAIPAPAAHRAPAAPAIPRPPITQPAADPIEEPKETFTTLMNKITDLVSKGKLNQAQVVKACQSAGVPSLPLVGTRPDLIPQISANIDLLIS